MSSARCTDADADIDIDGFDIAYLVGIANGRDEFAPDRDNADVKLRSAKVDGPARVRRKVTHQIHLLVVLLRAQHDHLGVGRLCPSKQYAQSSWFASAG